MALDPIHAFYCRKPYLELSKKLKAESNGKCADCGGIFNKSFLRTHHIIELNLENINDVNITLNPKNIEVICHDCHNKTHRRFGATLNKKVYVVWGAPCSGKSEYVSQVATRYDLVVDLDRIHQSITSCNLYDKPEATKRTAFAIYDLLLDRIKVRKGEWECAYIIGMFPDRMRREYMEREYGAELIHMDAPIEECIRRAYDDESRSSVINATVTYIKDYFDRVSF